jgi:hypothetical protein
MHRSNPLGWASGVLALGAGLLGWYVLHDFPVASKIILGAGYCAVLSLAGFWMWQHGQRRARLIEDIPTSKIATAPQGYVELLGRAGQVPDLKLVSGLSGTPCVWYRWEIARRRNGDSREFGTALLSAVVYWPEQSEESQSSFGIDDGTGSAIIFPFGAEVIAAHRQVWYEGDARCTEERILPGDSLYVLGDFSTFDPSQAPFDLMNEVSAQISVWRADQPALLARFDANRDGVLDADEWEAMHHEALRLARQREAESRVQPTVNRIMLPDHDRRYLLSSRPPESLAGHYHFWRGMGLVLFLGGGALGIWLGGLGLLR